MIQIKTKIYVYLLLTNSTEEGYFLYTQTFASPEHKDRYLVGELDFSTSLEESKLAEVALELSEAMKKNIHAEAQRELETIEDIKSRIFALAPPTE